MTTYLEQRLAEAESDGPVHEFGAGDALHTETADLPLDVTVVEQHGGKYYTMWHTEELTERLIHVNQMAGVMKRRYPADAVLVYARPGGKVFTVDRPKHRPPELVNFCRLHPDDPDRERWNAMGLPRCAKSLANPYEVDRHMQKKHATAWGTIERERLRAERDEDRKAQRVMMETLTKQTLEDPSFTEISPRDVEVVKDWKDAAVGVDSDSQIVSPRRVTVECAICGHKTWSTTQLKANNKLKKHMEATHAANLA